MDKSRFRGEYCDRIRSDGYAFEMRHRPIAPFVWLTLALAASGCVEVPAYDRGRLAQPSMTTSDLANASEAHVRAVQEGATGGSFAAGTGCGCN